MPPKVKVFWWRVLREFIPTKDNVLQRRHIEPLGFRDICGADRESIKHTLLECTIARIFWQEMRILSGAKLPHYTLILGQVTYYNQAYLRIMTVLYFA